ncbi:MAG: hypothetical protein H6924_03490 [Alphaproteobacteria bacterium]|nr:hypothetical protein [Alphaproteobacteria bacterium]
MMRAAGEDEKSAPSPPRPYQAGWKLKTSTTMTELKKARTCHCPEGQDGKTEQVTVDRVILAMALSAMLEISAWNRRASKRSEKTHGRGQKYGETSVDGVWAITAT